MNNPKRGLAALVATSLSAAGLATVALAPPVQAADPVPGVLTWEISQQFDDHLSTHVLTDGATEDDATGVITFPGGVGSYDPVTHETTVAYEGSVAGSFVNAGTTYYTVTIADPAVTIDDAGEGEITALVSSSSPGAVTEPARVVVTTFDGAAATWAEVDADLDSVTATPRWAGVLPPDSEQSTALDIGAGKPVEGKSFDPAFLGNLTSGVRAHFYASGSGSDAKKPPAAFTAQVAEEEPAVVMTPTVQVATTGASYADGLDLAVTGSEFTGATNPGDDGVYVGLAPSGALPDTSSQESMDLFAASAWVPAGAITDGSFATELNAKTEKLDKTKSYSVYTWQAHSHSNTTQDTETPVTIDWSKLAAPQPPAKAKSTLGATWVKKPTTKQGGRLTIQVRGTGVKPTGRVSIQLVKAGKVKRTLAKGLTGGKATFALAKLTAGGWKVRVKYVGSARYLPAAKVLTFQVRRPRG